MTGDLIAFLNARLDEDERIAKAATPGPWHIPEHDPIAYCVDSPDGSGRICKFGDRACSDDVHNSLHVVRHDPARVLREVTAKRVIVTRYAAVRRAFDDREGGLWPDVSRREKSHAYATLCDLAGIWSDHPDYRDEWAS